MTELCKLNPCCGNHLNCSPPPQFKPNESWEDYKRRTTTAEGRAMPKVYEMDDGRRRYAILAGSRKAAVASFCEAGLHVTEYYVATYGAVWNLGEHEDNAPVEAMPGVIFEATIGQGGSYAPAAQFQTPAGRAALAMGEAG